MLLGEEQGAARQPFPAIRGSRGGRHAGAPVRVIRGERVADRERGVVADHGEPFVGRFVSA
jgi:hypothetical protein